MERAAEERGDRRVARFICRAGLPVAVPADYATQPEHAQLVAALNGAAAYETAVAILEHHAVSWLAADILAGAPWAQRFLNTTARLHYVAPAKARRGIRALLAVLHGTPLQVGRRHAPLPSVASITQAVAVSARWRAILDDLLLLERSSWVSAIATAAAPYSPLSHAHLRALRALVRRRTCRKHDLVLTLTSWETGVPIRRLRTPPVAEFAYR